MRVGLYGGSFNPVHYGHLRAVEEVREAAALDQVWLVPASAPPHKDPEEIAPAAARLRMLELALDDRLALGPPGALRVESIELQRPGPSFTFDTVRALKALHPETEFALILGLDSFREIHTWHEHAALLTECDLIVTSRPPDRVPESSSQALGACRLPIAVTIDFCYQEHAKCFIHRSGRRLDFLNVTQIDISASRIRALVRDGRSIRFLTPDAVVSSIQEQRLYRAAPVPGSDKPHRL
ncbi:MAG TPA: nicotinate (nicotinamide) nucleotide adenylyltransferase [Candidatus Bathyarchaeia archaeon]|nr:nicotinate (nicotinamide) nucleotide adenylyltransferase [Candidatus Bathyarchaeia archaeon]